MTMIKIPQIGYQGSQANDANALINATITATVRAHTAPVKTPNPANSTTMPPIRWIHPQVVESNCNTYFGVTA